MKTKASFSSIRGTDEHNGRTTFTLLLDVCNSDNRCTRLKDLMRFRHRAFSGILNIAVFVAIAAGCRKQEEIRASEEPTRVEKSTAQPKPAETTVRWRGPKRTMELKVGPYTIRIPDRWRDLTELDAPGNTAAGMVSMTPEKPEDGATLTSIVVGWAALTPGKLDPKDPPCADMAELVGKRFQAKVSDVSRIEFEGDAGCGWTATSADLRLVQRVRFQEGHQLFVQWTRLKPTIESELGSDAKVWADVLSALHFTK